MALSWGYKGMIMNKKQLTLKLSTIAVSILLASCGGGGDGYYGKTSDLETNPDNPSQIVKDVNISNIELKDTNDTVTQTVSVAGATAKVKVTDKSGKAISGALVTFNATGGVEFGTSNGAVLTNAEGEASISIKPTNAADTGSYQLSASVEHNGTSATTASYNFSLQASKITLVDVKVGETTLNSGASTNITLNTKDANTNVNQNNVTVNFAASCGTFEPATVVSSNQGDVTTSYKAIGADGKLCAGKQTITVTGSNIAEAKTVEVNIAAIEANSLVYTSNAVNMGIKGSGSALSGQVEFILYANGVPATDKDVKIELEKSPEGLSFVSEGNFATQVVKSDSQGKVIVNLYPGNKPGPVEIKATLVSNDKVFALSKDVAVSTGRVYQSGLSLSVSKNALRTDIDGDTATVTARMVDRNGNPVPKGTVISFVAEGGSITPNCASDDNGVCTVTLTTQNPRPANNRVSVLAYVEGDKAYTDLDGDNLYTEGVDTLLSNIGDFFRDDDENLAYNADNNEYLYKRSDAGTAACAASTITQPNLANTCHNRLSATLRHQMLFAFSHDAPTFVGISGIDQAMTKITNDRFTFQVFGNTQRLVPMPSGTTVSVSVKDNTDFKPAAKLEVDPTDSTKKVLSVTGAEPNSTAIVEIDGTVYPVTIGSNGVGEKKDLLSTVTGTPQVIYENQSCEAEIVSGYEPVPQVMSLLTPDTFGLASNNIVKYGVRLQKCAAGDDIKVSVQVPGGQQTTIYLSK